MVLSRAQRQAALIYILEDTFDLDPDSPLHKILAENAITSPFDLLSMRTVEYEVLEYTDNKNVAKSIARGHVGLLKAF